MACIAASARRLAWSIAPTPLEPRLLLKALEGDGDHAIRRGLQQAFAADNRFVWERELFAAFEEADDRARDARVNEQLLEFEGRTGRWSRVPRVCASVGTSAGLLLASLAMVNGLALPAGEEGVGGTAIREAMSSALAALSFGVAAASFCVATHVRAARVCRERRAAIDQLAVRLAAPAVDVGQMRGEGA
jgi:hypothetical protein